MLLHDHGMEAASLKSTCDTGLRETLDIVREMGATALVVDSYDVREEAFAAIDGPFVVVIDDLGDRLLPVDLVINGSIHAMTLRYRVPSRTRLMLGPRYMLLREDFAREPQRTVRERVERVLVTVGGSDPSSLTPRFVEWVRHALGPVEIDVVVGPLFPLAVAANVETMAQGDSSITVHRDPWDVSSLMFAADLTVCGGGQTTYELAATGTPALAIRLAENQTGNLTGLSAEGAIAWVGDLGDRDLRAKVVTALVALSSSPGRREAMSRSGRRLVDGRGAQRVAGAIAESCGK
jgi:UDP-2,4-diacetamido-2,4,6-trideoxy-beta-L-altropyranose hydrolase